MSVIIEVPGHGEVEFPDGMSDADMEAAIRKNFMMPEKQKPSRAMQVGTNLMRGLMTGGPLGAAVAGVGEASSLGSELMDKVAYDAGGKVTDLTGSPELGFAANVATQAIPTALGGLSGKALSPTLQSMGKTFMQSALKPSKLEHISGKGKRAVQTMLDEGVNVSPGGVEKMRGGIDDLKTQVENAISGSNATVSRNAVASRVLPVVDKYSDSPTPNLSVKPIEAVYDDFMTHPASFPVQKAQVIKQTGGKELGDAAYGAGLKPAAERDARKALVRGLKEEIEKAVPAVGPLNAKEAELINALKITQNRVAMDANKNPLGLGALMTQPWMLPIWMWDRSPLAKSMTARGLYSGAGPIGTGVGAGLGGLYGAEQGQK